MRVDPICCHRPTPERAAEFASLPYDVFDRDAARAYVGEHPRSFLAIDRPETGFGPGQDMHAPEVYAHAHALLELRVQDGTLLRDGTPCYYLWRLERDGHAQTGVVCGCSVDEYLSGTIRRHESTTTEKEEDRVRHIDATDAQTGPIFLCYRDNYAIDALVSAACGSMPLYDFVGEDGVSHSIWRVARPSAVEALRACFSTVGCAYVADGHHRAAGAARVALERRRRAREAGGTQAEQPSDLFLAVLFPASQLQLLPYNRVVGRLGDCHIDGPQGLVGAMDAAGLSPRELGGRPHAAPARGSADVFVGGTWWRADLASRGSVTEGDPVRQTDAQRLQDQVLGPLLGITNPREDARMRFVGGTQGMGRLEVLAGEGGAAFSLHPCSIEEIMAVSDAGLTMPPKSSWFEPKLLSGLFIRHL